MILWWALWYQICRLLCVWLPLLCWKWCSNSTNTYVVGICIPPWISWPKCFLESWNSLGECKITCLRSSLLSLWHTRRAGQSGYSPLLPLKPWSGYLAVCLVELGLWLFFNSSVIDGSLLPLFLRDLIFWLFWNVWLFLNRKQLWVKSRVPNLGASSSIFCASPSQGQSTVNLFFPL